MNHGKATVFMGIRAFRIRPGGSAYLASMTTSRRTSLALAATSLLCLPAISLAEVSPISDIPDNQAFVVQSGAGYSLKVPDGWSRTGAAARTTFSDKYNTISIETRPSAKPPTTASVTKTELPTLAKRAGFQRGTVTKQTRPAGTAILITYRALSAPLAVTGKRVLNDVERYEFWKAGRLAVLTLQAPKGSDNVDPWKVVTTSFAWKR